MMLTMLATAALSFSPGSYLTRSRVLASSSIDMKIGLIYSTTTGNTETIAGYIAAVAPVDGPHDAADISDVSQYDGLIVGAPTWHTGADTERSGTSWDDWLYNTLPGLKDAINGKPVACFGVGDQIGYSDNFCDALGELADCFEGAGAKLVGFTSPDGYEHTDSKAIRGGQFCGLACDEDNEADKSEERVNKWIEQLKKEGMPF